MSQRNRGLVLIAAGAVLAALALAADAVGLGPHPGIGWKQILGVLAGAGLAVIGVADLRR